VNKSSSKDWTKGFNDLLSWLDPDRERSGEKYQTIRQRLVKIFTWQRCADPEALADETITRVAAKVSEIRKSYVGDPSLFFYGVARNVLREAKRSSKMHQAMEDDVIAPESDEDESRLQLHDCLDQCLLTLSTANRKLLLTYYEESTKQGTVKSRHALAAQLGLQPSALRMRVLRIRTTLEKCIETCMKVTSQHKNT
jgi:RNA polymerase sigma factor (sigma-70 family)